jgi:hypothetical protein
MTAWNKGIDSLAPVKSFITHYANSSVARLLTDAMTDYAPEFTHYFVPISAKQLEKLRTFKTCDVTDVYDKYAKELDALRVASTRLEKALQSADAKRRIAVRHYLESNDKNWYVDVWPTFIERNKVAAERDKTNERLRVLERVFELAKTSTSKELIPCRKVMSITKNGGQLITGYGLFDEASNRIVYIKTVARGNSAIAVNSYTPHILSQLIIEPAVTTYKHRYGYHKFYSLRFVPIKHTETFGI